MPLVFPMPDPFLLYGVLPDGEQAPVLIDASGRLQATVTGTPTATFRNAVYAASFTLDFHSDAGKLIAVGTLSGDIEFSFSNVLQGRWVTVDLICGPAAVEVIYPPNARPYGVKVTELPAGKALAVTFHVTRSPSGSTDDSAVRFACGLQP